MRQSPHTPDTAERLWRAAQARRQRQEQTIEEQAWQLEREQREDRPEPHVHVQVTFMVEGGQEERLQKLINRSHKHQRWNTFSKVLRAAVWDWLSRPAQQQACPEQLRCWNMKRRTRYGTAPRERSAVLTEAQFRRLHSLKESGLWPTVAEILRCALEAWLDREVPMPTEWHKALPGCGETRPRPKVPRQPGVFMTLAEHNQRVMERTRERK